MISPGEGRKEGAEAMGAGCGTKPIWGGAGSGEVVWGDGVGGCGSGGGGGFGGSGGGLGEGVEAVDGAVEGSAGLVHAPLEAGEGGGGSAEGVLVVGGVVGAVVIPASRSPDLAP